MDKAEPALKLPPPQPAELRGKLAIRDLKLDVNLRAIQAVLNPVYVMAQWFLLAVSGLTLPYFMKVPFLSFPFLSFRTPPGLQSA
ncbi:hypothetical protein [Desertivirga arenae]|uniref:hypothetical protein n=1 Tax=Desertivirga arenae TaxID=2810309 RepID=UPI001A95CDD2|nr:hypothetical protein [Pedobacter sp. SYSU D00823]